MSYRFETNGNLLRLGCDVCGSRFTERSWVKVWVTPDGVNQEGLVCMTCVRSDDVREGATSCIDTCRAQIEWLEAFLESDFLSDWPTIAADAEALDNAYGAQMEAEIPEDERR
jgi:hypothetical protein